MTTGKNTGEIWVLGATGRVGRAVAARLSEQGVIPVLVGRRRESLAALQAELGHEPENIIVTDGVRAIAAEIGKQRPAVVVNLIGEYAETATVLAEAVMPGGHYIDLAVDMETVPRLLGLHAKAVQAGSTLVTASGFGVLATEAVVLAMCADRPTPQSVRVDALASVATEDGVIGTAFASEIVGAMTKGSQRYVGGKPVKARLGADPQTLTTPDGETVKSGGAPTTELLAAWRASGAPSVIATSTHAPTGTLARATLPLATTLLSIPSVRQFAVGQMAKGKTKAAPRPRKHSWGHAVISWPDGTAREGWLRAGDGMDFTAAVAGEVAMRLARGEGSPGAYTPAAAFGADLAVSAGGTFLLD